LAEADFGPPALYYARHHPLTSNLYQTS
jgi:hypothetical protein